MANGKSPAGEPVGELKKVEAKLQRALNRLNGGLSLDDQERAAVAAAMKRIQATLDWISTAVKAEGQTGEEWEGFAANEEIIRLADDILARDYHSRETLIQIRDIVEKSHSILVILLCEVEMGLCPAPPSRDKARLDGCVNRLGELKSALENRISKA